MTEIQSPQPGPCISARPDAQRPKRPDDFCADNACRAVGGCIRAHDPAERKAAEQAYATTAFNYPEAPVGSRDWCLFWDGWRIRAAMGAIPAPEGAQLPPLPEPVAQKRFHMTHDLEPGVTVALFTAGQMHAYARAALAAPAPQAKAPACALDYCNRPSACEADGVCRATCKEPAPQAPVALTDETLERMWFTGHGGLPTPTIAYARAVIAEFCRVNGIKEPTNDR